MIATRAVRSADLTNEAGTIRAWRIENPAVGVGPPDWQAGFGSWFINADRFVLDPFGITSWFVGVTSLLDLPGVPAAHRQYPEAEFELLSASIDPDKGVDVAFYDDRVTGAIDPGSAEGILLTPFDIAFQWHGTSNDDAVRILEAFVRAVVLGSMSPSRPPRDDSLLPGSVAAAAAFDAAWRDRLTATVEHFANGHWASHLTDGEHRA